MNDYPTQAGQRRLKRGELRSRALRSAARGWIPRSRNCEDDRHSWDPYGCRNDGTGCLCGCHDPQDT